MLVATTYDSAGHETAQQWFCDRCEVEELQRRGLPIMRHGEVRTLALHGRWREELRHSDTDLPPWCFACEH